MIKKSTINSLDETLYKSEEINFEKNKKKLPFKFFAISSQKLCLGDFNSEIVFILINKSTQEEIFYQITCINKLLKDKIIIINEKSYVEISLKIQRSYQLIDYLEEGLEMKMIMAIDFTKSNGNPNIAGSLHEFNTNQENPYEKSMRICGDLISPYSTHNTFPCFGFGAIIPNKPKVSFCFNLDLNSNDNNPEIETMDKVLEIYNETLRKIRFKDPTYFCPIINKVIEMAKKNKEDNIMIYKILIIMTDGKIKDRIETVNAICEAAKYPISIIIVGVGGCNFDDMYKLEEKAEFLINKERMQINRKIIDFIPFIKYESNIPLLKEKIFEDIPSKIIEFFAIEDISPSDFSNIYNKKI
jgi:hypothetical protein